LYKVQQMHLSVNFGIYIGKSWEQSTVTGKFLGHNRLADRAFEECNLTQGCIAAAHGRFSRIHQVAPMCTPSSTPHSASPQYLCERHRDRFSRFCRAHGRDRPTGRQTEHATHSVAVGCIRSTVMRPKMFRFVLFRPAYW